MNITDLKAEIFKVLAQNFEELALAIFRYQANTIPVYRKYIELLNVDIHKIVNTTDIPFLPISFFKSHVICDNSQYDLLFKSSGTIQQIRSQHFVRDNNLYHQSFLKSFTHFFGNIDEYCILGLLPSYIENGESSLVYMVDDLIKKSKHVKSGFYLHNHNELFTTIQALEQQKQKTILIGVTYALLDFAEKYSLPLQYVNIIETGGMKGRREEWTRENVHTFLKEKFKLSHIYSEYGMTELLSQAYSLQQGIFETPHWMKVLVRELNDPFSISHEGKGAINIIDLANIHSCSFIATDDFGEINNEGFKILGRIELSEIRGCSLLTL